MGKMVMEWLLSDWMRQRERGLQRGCDRLCLGFRASKRSNRAGDEHHGNEHESYDQIMHGRFLFSGRGSLPSRQDENLAFSHNGTFTKSSFRKILRGMALYHAILRHIPPTGEPRMMRKLRRCLRSTNHIS